MSMSETRTIKDLQFWYREAFKDPYSGDTLVREKIASRGETITITHPEDLRRGDEANSFYTDEELDSGAHLRPADLNTEVQDQDQVPETPEAGAEAPGTPTSAPNLSEDSVDDIAAWMTAERPNVSTVLELAYQYSDDEDALNKLLDAEDQFTGDEARKGVVEGVQKILGDSAQ